MTNFELISELFTPTHNKVLVKVTDTYNIKKSKGGLILSNAAHEEAKADSEGYNLSEWIIRHGEVVRMPRTLTKTGYDWEPCEEIEIGDEVYWSIVRFFDYPAFKKDYDFYLVVDYCDIYLRKRKEEITPVNGYYMFTQETVTKSIMEYEYEKNTEWHFLEKKGKDVVYDHHNDTQVWEVGEKCLLSVPPFKLEADTDGEFDKQYFLAQKRHILLSI